MHEKGKCPVTGRTKNTIAGGGTSNRDWWPNQLNLKILHQKSNLSKPMGADFNYAEEFRKLDLEALKKDLFALMNTGRIGGLLITVTTVRSLSGWRGTAQARTAQATAAAAQGPAPNALHPSTAGLTM